MAKDRQFEWERDKMSYFYLVCSPCSKSKQVLEEFRCPKRRPAHHENLSLVSKWQLFASPSSSRSRRSLSKIALCSHEYFIFILLKKRSVAFVLRLLCILTRSSFLFGGEKNSCEVNKCDEKWGWGMNSASESSGASSGKSNLHSVPLIEQLCRNYFSFLFFFFLKVSLSESLLCLAGLESFRWESPTRKSPRLWTVCWASIGVTSCLCRAQGHRAIAFLFVFSLSWQPFTFDFEK